MYVAVLGVALIVAVIGLASLQISRIETRAAVTANEIATARQMAQSGIELALAQLDAAGSTWRTDFTHGEEVPPSSWITLSGDKFKFILLDDDGDLADDDTDLVTIRAIGRSGGATSVTTVTYAPAGTGFSCLEASLHSDGTLGLGSVTVTTDQQVSSNGNVNGAASTVDGDAWAVGTINGLVTGTKYPNQTPPRDLPDPVAVFDYYLANGTAIDYSDIASGTGVIDGVVLTRGNNPYGAGTTNSQGIYVIDCGGNDVVIKNSRLEATLVLLNAGGGSRVEGTVHWEPAAANYPSMLVQGNMLFDWNGIMPLDESALGVNFNPAGSPFQGSGEDSDTADTYNGVIEGLTYISGSLSTTSLCVADGVIVVGGTCDVQSNLNLTYRDVFLNYPPPGFADGTQMRLVPGSWTRSAY